jgi:hypothetical protein
MKRGLMAPDRCRERQNVMEEIEAMGKTFDDAVDDLKERFEKQGRKTPAW